jgi:hypothetical protein
MTLWGEQFRKKNEKFNTAIKAAKIAKRIWLATLEAGFPFFE